MENIHNFMLNRVLYYHFPKKELAEKSYSTFNLKLSMVWANQNDICRTWRQSVGKKPSQPNILNQKF